MVGLASVICIFPCLIWKFELSHVTVSVMESNLSPCPLLVIFLLRIAGDVPATGG